MVFAPLVITAIYVGSPWFDIVVVVAGLLMAIYGIAPLAVLLTIQHVAEELRTQAVWGALIGAGLSLAAWALRPQPVALIQIGALVLLFITCMMLPGCLNRST